MDSSTKNLVIFFLLLSIVGLFVATLLSPINYIVLVFSGLISVLGNAFLFIAIGIFLIIVGFNNIISETIVKITTYRDLNKIHPNRRIAKILNGLKIYIYNLFFGVLLTIAVIFLISTIFPFQSPSTVGGISDFDFALITAMIVVPGLLLSLRLLSNPMERTPIKYMRFFIPLPLADISSASVIKERIQSFYFAFIETAIVSILILGSYYILKNGDGTFKIYFIVLKEITPNLPYTSLFTYSCGFLFSLFVTTTIGEFLLEKGNPIIQE